LSPKEVSARKHGLGATPVPHPGSPLRRHKGWLIAGGVIAFVAVIGSLSVLLSGSEGTGDKVVSESAIPKEVPDFSLLLYQGGDILGSE